MSLCSISKINHEFCVSLFSILPDRMINLVTNVFLDGLADSEANHISHAAVFFCQYITGSIQCTIFGCFRGDPIAEGGALLRPWQHGFNP